jgi:Fe-S cluster assembly protein SufD
VPSLSTPALTGFTRENLETLIANLAAPDSAVRRAAFARFESLTPTKPASSARGNETSTITLDGLRPFDFSAVRTPALSDIPDAHVVIIDGVGKVRVDPVLARLGVHATSFRSACAADDGALQTILASLPIEADTRWGSLVRAFATDGVFIDVPQGVRVEVPITIVHSARELDAPAWTLVRAGAGARVSVIERINATAERTFIGRCDVIAELGSHVSITVLQDADPHATVLWSRNSHCASEAVIEWAIAQLGARMATDTLVADLNGEGARATVAAVFFSTKGRFIDFSPRIRHLVPKTTSETVVKSAASAGGRGRSVGDIVIAAAAHGSQASLRADALLLSADAHLDCVPALEIAANDVSAFHGATVGTLDDEELFYAQSRGIPRDEAERLIALGFFEPALARFPDDAVRKELRERLASLLTSENVA